MNLWPPLPKHRRFEWLTPREREVFACIADRQLSTAGTASALRLSTDTVLLHRKRINAKLRTRGLFK